MPDIEIRELDGDMVPVLQDAFCVPGWNKPREQYGRYLEQHESGEIVCFVAWVGDELAGYVKVVWEPSYEALAAEGIPEIQDLNVLERFRRRGVATQLLDRAEEVVSKRSDVVGIGVGLHPGYNAAQRLYVLRGYVPDGRGVTYEGRYVQEGEQVPFDDNLSLNFTKELR